VGYLLGELYLLKAPIALEFQAQQIARLSDA
jgi:hypothetical protein